jgi:hypothetical protein
MNYKIGGIILSKKPHACGSNKWIIVRLGADVKLKCDNCGRFLFLSVDEVKKITKAYIEPGEDNGK